MNRWWLGVIVGLAMGAVAYGDELRVTRVHEEPQVTRLSNVLKEIEMKTASGDVFQLPDEYGHLVDVVLSGEVQHLYFEDQAGNIRVVLIGPRGAVQRSRSSLQLLSPDVFLMKRGRQPDAP